MDHSYLHLMVGEKHNKSSVFTFCSSYVSEFGAWCFLAPHLPGAFKRQTRSRFSSHSFFTSLFIVFTPKMLFMYNCSLKNGKRTFIALPQMVSSFFFFYVHFESIATYIFLDMQEKLKLIINDTCCIEFSFERVVALKERPGHADSWHGCGEAPGVPLTNHTCVNPKIMSKSDVLVIP